MKREIGCMTKPRIGKNARSAKNGRKSLRIIFRTEYAPSAAQALAPAARRKDIRTAMSGSKKSPQAEDGVVIMVCSVCGEKSAETIKAPGHETDGWEWDPTLHWHVCSRCGRTTDAQPHSFLGGNVCTVCGAERTSSGGIGHTHDWDEGTVTHAPTCTQTGTRVLTCRGCGITRTVEIPAAGHDFTGTYEKDGEQHWRLCANGCLETEEHVWDTGTVTQAPTCTKEGVRVFACTVCGEAYDEPVPVLGHEMGNWTQDDEDTHSRECTRGCGKRETEAHCFAGNTCTVCAFTLQYTESLIFEEYKSASFEGYAVAGFNGGFPQEVVIPSRYEGAPVVAVKSGVFRDSSVRSIVLGSNIRELGADCFLGCEQLTSITFGAAIGAEAIDAGAFRDCASLTVSVSADNASLTCRDNCLIDENGTLILGGGPTIPTGRSSWAAVRRSRTALPLSARARSTDARDFPLSFCRRASARSARTHSGRARSALSRERALSRSPTARFPDAAHWKRHPLPAPNRSESKRSTIVRLCGPSCSRLSG